MQRFFLGLRIALPLVIGITACGTTPTEGTFDCEPDCPPGQTCTETGCVATATGGPDLAAPPGDDMASSGCSPACAGATPHCNPARLCAACLTDEHCPMGQRCTPVGQTTACVPGCAGDARCGAGSLCCDGRCVDTAQDARNCGACGMVCGGQHSTARCEGGRCVPGTCHAGWGDCNMDPVDGCEVKLDHDPDHCNGCGKQCKLANATAGCGGITDSHPNGCYLMACVFGFDDCNGNADDGCEQNVFADAKNCGRCGYTCTTVPNAKVACFNATCGVSACNVGFADCDANLKNGCEVAIGSDKNNCGACGTPCGQGQVCVNGACTCQQCNIANAKTKCVNNMCVFDSCVMGFADCDNNINNGCEAELTKDPNNCGACGNVCPVNMPACIEGKCLQAGKCSDVAQAYCRSKGWFISPWQTAWPNQPGGSIFCTSRANAAGSDCDSCNTYNQLVWRNGARDACNSGMILVPGRAYGGHNPCSCQANNFECGEWPHMNCIPD